ncbi:iron chelate uptake ABC transporter family permease subunit [Aquibacillus halophilus]|uniref:Iron chelate uptake ABC transporter family permease subunit n=1 Tax=Aquibacillus halophilus TaxID=930132 RepID=A0A6A8DJB2_9BACI|nr:iron ABC transporter permease [Aquibacillus halophilus]MRH43819.1 iron chelate uptake ABC transporter family permease subunit [Aquibacillus halophilus]
MTKFISIRNKSGSLSYRLNRKTSLTFLILFLFSILLFLVCLSVGSSFIHPFAVINHLLGNGTGEYDFVINTLRLPRVLLGFMIGAALGVSGLILQGIIRNPLASPDIIGITGGASVGAIIFIVSFMGTVSVQWLPLAALLGAGIVATFTYVMSWKDGVTPIRLVLIGIGVAAAMKALTTMMIVLSDTYSTSTAYLWLTGSLYAAKWQDVYSMLPWIILFIPLALLFSRIVNVKQLGDDVATALGVRVQLYRMILLFISVALAGSAVAYAGGIGFVGLIAPHISRMIADRSFSSLVPITSLVGGIIVVLSDLVARTAFLPLDIPAGVFTSGIGAPFFIYLLYRNRNM